MKLEGKTALITGASSGIGKEFAYLLSRKGMNLVLNARSKDKLEEIKKNIESRSRVRVDIVVDDLSTNSAPKRIFNIIQRRGINIDLLVNNAGFGYIGDFEKEDYDKNREMIMVNVLSMTSLSRLFIPQMIQRGEGGIINVASLAGMRPFPYAAAYAATKSYVYNFSQALWEEYREKGIIVSCLCPGLTKTNFGKVAGREEMFERGLDPKIVAEEALIGFLEKEPIVVPEAHKNFMIEYGSKFLSRKKMLEMAGKVFRVIK